MPARDPAAVEHATWARSATVVVPDKAAVDEELSRIEPLERCRHWCSLSSTARSSPSPSGGYSSAARRIARSSIVRA